MKLFTLLSDWIAESNATHTSITAGDFSSDVRRPKVKVPKPQHIVKSTQPITLFGDSSEPIAQIGKRGIPIRTIPFSVGLAGKIIYRSNRDWLSLLRTGEDVQLEPYTFKRRVLDVRD